MPVYRNNKLHLMINHRVKVNLQDSRNLVGSFLAFDKYMNLILADCDEMRVHKQKAEGEYKEAKRTLGFVLLRGDSIVTITVVGPPNPNEEGPKLPVPGSSSGPGFGRSAGRGMSLHPPPPPPPSCGRGPPPMPGMAQGPYPGVGQPHMGMMQPPNY